MYNNTKICLILTVAAIGLMASFGVNAATFPSNSCTSHFFKGCIGSSSYWYDSCGRQEGINLNCAAIGSACQSGECVSAQASVASNTAINNTANTTTRASVRTAAASPALFRPANIASLGFFVKHFRTGCYNDNVFWYNSQAGIEDIATKCQDENACTLDRCTDNACSNKLMCDGTTCSLGSDDFQKYCVQNAAAINAANQSSDNAQPETAMVAGEKQDQDENVSIAMFGKRSLDLSRWQKLVTLSNNEEIDFFITVKNTTPEPLHNIALRVGFNSNVEYANNLKVDSVSLQGNIAEGFNIENLEANSSMIITFAGIARSAGAEGTVATVDITGSAAVNSTPVDTDTLKVTILSTSIIAPSENTQSTQDATQSNPQENQTADDNMTVAAVGASPVAGLFKSWYLWGALIAAALVGLFIVIFRRLSQEV